MADEPTIIEDVPGRKRATSVTCEFCECRLSAAGDVLQRSPKARALIDQDDAFAKATQKIATLDAKIAELQTELAARIAPVPTDKKRGFIYDDD